MALPPSPTADQPASATLAELAEAYHTHQMAADPLAATYHGLVAHRDALPDVTAEGQAGIRRRAEALRTAVAHVPAHGLDATERTTRSMLLELLGWEIAELDQGWVEFSVDAFDHGPQVELLFVLSRVDVDDAAAADDLLTRLAQVGTHLDAALTRHRDGLDGGRSPVHRGVSAAIAQCRATAAQPAGDAHLLAPLRAWEGLDPTRRARAERLWTHVVAPAFTRYADGLAADVEPHARPDDRAGLCWLPGGDELYAAALRRYTTLGDPDPDEIHATGLRLVAALAAEYAEIGSRALGLDDLAAITHRLHTDPDLDYAHPDEIVAHAQQLVDMAADRVGEVVGRLPSTPCVVRAIPEVEARGAAAAFYQVPADTRPHGTYWVNTTDPVLARWKAEATAFHEASPGHHTQLGLQRELDLPTFRRFGTLLSGYAEGWGLYTERLAAEMGMYSGDVALLGMLATDSMRACRLVVDTGLHHLGWSRQQAIDYMRANSPLPAGSVRAEIDRYVVYPGQACAYALGRLEIQRLRADAERRLGPAFDLRAFHDVVLGQGSVPLGVLADNVEAWAAGRSGTDGDG
ncbi:DUF885 family protein [Euzebya sp.]|uniref:DUF885 domain-containing protein n=1 Tax=Euzebya sp. TaxID=1971409 RepID=UPI0035138BF4